MSFGNEIYSVETRLIGKEDLLLDKHGNGNESSYKDANNISRKLTPISASIIPLPSALRVKCGNAADVAAGMNNIIDQVAAINEDAQENAFLQEDTTVLLLGSLSYAEKQVLIDQQLTNLGGQTLTFEFQEAFDIESAGTFEFQGFYNGTLIIDLNSISLSDSADIGQLLHVHSCSCKVEIKNGTIKHLSSPYGIKAENCPCFYLANIAFFSQGGASNYALHGLCINGVISNCTYTDDNELLLNDLGGSSYKAYADAKVNFSMTGHIEDSNAHSGVINAHNTSNDAHQELFLSKAPVDHTHTASEQAAAATALNAHNIADDAHSLLFDELINGLANNALFAGLIVPYVGTVIPIGYFLCDGSAISREVYASLFSVIGETFGEGDGETTFNIPDLRGKFIRGLGGDSAALGVTQAEGLPDITGSLGPISSANYVVSGAFYRGASMDGAGKGQSDYRTNFAASRSNSIYGASSHVTPINMAVNFIIRYV